MGKEELQKGAPHLTVSNERVGAKVYVFNVTRTIS